MTDFVSLHNHTDFSILDSLISPKELFLKAKELGQKAVAITDHATLASAWDAWKISKETGVKLIIGCEFYFLNDANNHEEKIRHVILLAKNHAGYKNLLQLCYKGYDNSLAFGKRQYPIIDWNLLETHAEGLICLTSCSNGIIAQLINNRSFDQAEKQLLRLKNIFNDNLGLEVQANALKRPATHYNEPIDQIFTNSQLIKLGKAHNIKLVATTNAHYLTKDQADTHDILLCIGSGQPKFSNARLKYDVPDFYVKSGDEVKSFFSRNYGEEFAEQLCANSVLFADMCEEPAWIDPKYSNPSGKELPSFPVKDEPDYNQFLVWRDKISDEDQKLDEDKLYLRYKCELAALTKFPADKYAEYKQRLDTELDTLYFCGVSSYMLVVADYVNWAKNNGVSVGPGRGSVSGCLVAYLLDIHEADPIKYGLVFERFHNKLKQSYSDIDIDFSQASRGKVIGYLVSKYGQDRVAHVSNINTITPKVYSRDIARACEFGGSRKEAVRIGTEIADTIPKEVTSMSGVLKNVPLFVEYSRKKYPELEKHSIICGKYRNMSNHAAGMIVSNRPLVDIVPIRRDKDGNVAIEYDKDRAEDNGLVKLDLLGLKNLDQIDLTLQFIKQSGKTLPNFNYDEYDQKTYDLISSGDTFCVFQFGTSQGTIDLCKKIKPKCIEDLAIITALARPAVKEIREDFVKTKNGLKKMELIHPLLENAFKNTFGYPLYDESLLILARDVAGWDLGEADKLRKLTKEKGKNPAKAKKWKTDFLEGANKNGVSDEDSEKVWTDIVEPFGKYGFNKSLFSYELIDIFSATGEFLASKKIEDVIPGEFVRSRDEDTQKEIFIEVLAKHDHGILPLVEVELTTGETIRCTLDHKFRVQESGEMLPLRQIIKESLTIIVNFVSQKNDVLQGF